MATLEGQLRSHYGLDAPACRDLRTPTNDVVEVRTADDGHYALKLYNVGSRRVPDVQWEIDLTRHLVRQGAPVAPPVAATDGATVTTLDYHGEARAAALFRWAPGEKPRPTPDTWRLVGDAAARIHAAADTFSSPLPRERYDAEVLLDEQLARIAGPLAASGQHRRVHDLAARLRRVITAPGLDRGVCHMDLSLDNVHRDGDRLTVFDLDSAGLCWRALEPASVRRASELAYGAWLEGYRAHRPFSAADERAVAAFGIVNEIRGVVWKLGYAKSSRGAPLLTPADLPAVVDEWLSWERDHLTS